jgi:hypothetical protein
MVTIDPIDPIDPIDGTLGYGGHRATALAPRVPCDDDAGWDAFVAGTAGGSYRQSSLWAATKAPHGWTSRRLLHRRDDEIVAGAQLLVRPLPGVPWLGNIAHCARGPLIADRHAAVVAELEKALRRWCRRERVRVLIVQPPEGDDIVVPQLVRSRWAPSPIPVAPRSTALIDLTPELSTIWERLGRSLRRHLRRAEHAGVRVRRGSSRDVALFHRLHATAGARLGYDAFSLAYFQHLYDTFAAVGKAEIFFTEHEGRTLTAVLCLVFGDRAVSTVMGWSGDGAHLCPNDVLFWHTIRWAKTRGLRQLELENLSDHVARGLAAGRPLEDLSPSGSDRFKLKWNPDAVPCPPPYLHLSDPVARALFRRVPQPRLEAALRRLAARSRPVPGDAT